MINDMNIFKRLDDEIQKHSRKVESIYKGEFVSQKNSQTMNDNKYHYGSFTINKVNNVDIRNL